MIVGVCDSNRECPSLRLRSGQALAFFARVGGDAACTVGLVTTQHGSTKVAFAFTTPVLRREREGLGIHLIADAGELCSFSDPESKSVFNHLLNVAKELAWAESEGAGELKLASPLCC
jgi:hypothetical protein